MDIIHTINIYTHVIIGSLLLVLGLVPMVSKKGGTWHKRVGRCYKYLYLVVLATAIIGVVFFRAQPALMMITLAAVFNYVSGIRALEIRLTGPRMFDNLFALGIIVVSAAMLFMMSENGSASWSPTMGYSIIGVTVMYASYDLSRNFWATTWTEKVWPIDHGVKMIGSYFALASAASGNLITSFQPWSQISPSIIGSIISIGFIYLYFKHPRRILSMQ